MGWGGVGWGEEGAHNVNINVHQISKMCELFYLPTKVHTMYKLIWHNCKIYELQHDFILILCHIIW